MIAFAACFVIGMNAAHTTTSLDHLQPEVVRLVEGTVNVLDQLGSQPLHRKGAASVYASHLRNVLARAGSPMSPNRPRQTWLTESSIQPAPAYSFPGLDAAAGNSEVENMFDASAPWSMLEMQEGQEGQEWLDWLAWSGHPSV
jgi:hypothetical protein